MASVSWSHVRVNVVVIFWSLKYSPVGSGPGHLLLLTMFYVFVMSSWNDT